MKKSDKLFRLIKNLSRNEKRYFKLSASVQSGNNAYLRLFHLIEKQTQSGNSGNEPRYNEEKLLEEIDDPKLKKNLPVVKNYLFNQLLRTLRAYYDEDDVENKLLGWIRDIKLLKAKGLHQEALKLVAKAEKLAGRYEKYQLLLRIYQLENLLRSPFDPPAEFQNKIDQLFSRYRDALRREENLLGYRHLEAKFHILTTGVNRIHNNNDQQAFNAIMKDALLHKTAQPLSYEATMLYHIMHGINAEVQQQTSVGLQHYEKLLELQEDNPDLALEYPERYIANLRNYVLLSNIYGEDKRIWEQLNKLKNVNLNDRTLEEKARFLGIGIELAILSHRGRVQEAISRIEEARDIIAKFKIPMSAENELLLWFSYFQPHFRAENFSQAYDYLFKILNGRYSPSVRSDLQRAAVYLNTVVQFEMGNYHLLEHLIPSAKRQLKQAKSKPLQSELLVFDTVNKLISSAAHDHHDIYQNSLNKMIVHMQDDHEASLISYFHFIAWLQSKLQNRPFAELIAEKYEEQVARNKMQQQQK